MTFGVDVPDKTENISCSNDDDDDWSANPSRKIKGVPVLTVCSPPLFTSFDRRTRCPFSVVLSTACANADESFWVFCISRTRRVLKPLINFPTPLALGLAGELLFFNILASWYDHARNYYVMASAEVLPCIYLFSFLVVPPMGRSRMLLFAPITSKLIHNTCVVSIRLAPQNVLSTTSSRVSGAMPRFTTKGNVSCWFTSTYVFSCPFPRMRWWCGDE